MAYSLRLRSDLADMGEGIRRNYHQISYDVRASRNTVKRYAEEPEQIRMLDLDAWPSFMVAALGISPDELMEMRLRDLFELASR